MFCVFTEVMAQDNTVTFKGNGNPMITMFYMKDLNKP